MMSLSEKEQLVLDIQRAADDLQRLASKISGARNVYVIKHSNEMVRHVDRSQEPVYVYPICGIGILPLADPNIAICVHQSVKRWAVTFCYEECEKDKTIFVSSPRLQVDEDYSRAFRHPPVEETHV